MNKLKPPKKRKPRTAHRTWDRVFEACLAIEGDPELDNAVMAWFVMDGETPILHPHHAKLIAPIISHLDATVPDWRTR